MDEPSSPEVNAITLRIKFKSSSLEDFVTRYGADVSAGGIFIRTRQPLAVGAVLHFDFTLADGVPLIAGMGTVVWVREPDASRAGSVPGMGLRFDQLTPEGQQAHQQILLAKAKRGDRPMVTPPPIPTSAPTAQAKPKPATPPPIVGRPAPAAPVGATPAASAAADTSDEFGLAGKTEIADRPPSFYLEGLDGAKTASTGGQRAAQEAAPMAPLDDAETDSQQIAAADPSWSEPIDIDASGALSVPPGSQAAAAPAEARKDAEGGLENLDVATGAGPRPVPASDLQSPLADLPGTGSASSTAAPVGSAEGQSWLDRAMEATSLGGAAPVETAPEHTEKVATPSESTLLDAPAVSSGSAEQPALPAADASPPVPLVAARKSGGQGKKLIAVGILAAGVAFAGVYLLQAKPWQSSTEPGTRPEPTPPPAVPKVGEPAQPAMPAAAKVVAEPAKPAEPVKPAPAAAPSPPQEAAKANQPAAGAASPEIASESARHPGHPAGSTKKSTSKPGPSAPTAPAAAQGEDVYLLKVKSVPPGAQILIDGEPMGQTPFQRRILDADKPHVVMVRKPGYDSFERHITSTDPWVKVGNTATLNVAAKLVRLRAQPGAPPAAPANETAPGSDQPEKL